MFFITYQICLRRTCARCGLHGTRVPSLGYMHTLYEAGVFEMLK